MDGRTIAAPTLIFYVNISPPGWPVLLEAGPASPLNHDTDFMFCCDVPSRGGMTMYCCQAAPGAQALCSPDNRLAH
ncbi:hypothetical protein SAMN02745124_02226 [Desulfofustis glycolicus DSM 9705]|uniref:Uncharacterized protein n=1 Tax=Desulfofustis glycolicus DSM 9705 TaxID=1121409 RepID=A0A1M5WDW8_9BACT|nr:hypothetical protein SAMN02745124_02226 [Desulfofustis glycolicus DSM 9705]